MIDYQEILNSSRLKEDIGIFRLESYEEIPVWSAFHYLTALSNNYMKLLTLDKICDLLIHNCPQTRIFIEDTSLEIYDNTYWLRPGRQPDTSFHMKAPLEDYFNSKPFHHNTGRPRRIASLEMSEHFDGLSAFWYLFKTKRRPHVYYERENTAISLYHFSDFYDIKINCLKMRSPLLGKARAAIGIFTDLTEARKRDLREQALFEEKLKGQKLDTLGKYAALQMKLNDPRLPELHRKIIEEQVKYILNSQSSANEKAGIHSSFVQKVDIKI